MAQQHNKNSIVISVLSDFLQISLGGPGVIGPNNRIDVKYQYQLLDNRWHTLQFKYEYGNLYLYVDRTSRVFGKYFIKEGNYHGIMVSKYNLNLQSNNDNKINKPIICIISYL